VKLFQWRGRTSKKEFRKRFIELMREAAPQVRYAESDKNDLDLSIEGLADHGTAFVSLHRAYDEFLADPAERDQILARWVAAQERLVNPQPPARQNIVPMIKDRVWLKNYYAQYSEPVEPGSSRDMLYDEINEEFLVAYADYDGGIHYLHVSDLETIGLVRNDLRALALTNLRARTPERTLRIVGDVWMVHVGGNFESALVIDDDFWRHPKLEHLDPLIVAAPERDMLIAATGDSPAEIWHCAYMAYGFARDAAYPISSSLMIRRNDRFDLLDADVTDESHAIPHLQVIDVFAERKAGGALLGITIASPLDTSPRSVFRLFRKIHGYLEAIGSAEYSRKHGKATPENTLIEVNFTAPAHTEIVELLNGCVDYVASLGARLELRYARS
jgi:hypothetical protein